MLVSSTKSGMTWPHIWDSTQIWATCSNMEEITVTMIDHLVEEDTIRDQTHFLKLEVWVFLNMNQGDLANQKFMTTQEEDTSFQKVDAIRMPQ